MISEFCPQILHRHTTQIEKIIEYILDLFIIRILRCEYYKKKMSCMLFMNIAIFLYSHFGKHECKTKSRKFQNKELCYGCISMQKRQDIFQESIFPNVCEEIVHEIIRKKNLLPQQDISIIIS